MESAEKNKLFSDIVVRYSEKLYWTIRRIVLNHDDANDVMQNVFVKAWNNLEQFQERSNIYTWLYRIAINESLDFLRRKRDFVAYDTDLSDGVGSRLIADEYFDGDATQALLSGSHRHVARRAAHSLQPSLFRRDEVFRHEPSSEHVRRRIEGQLPYRR